MYKLGQSFVFGAGATAGALVVLAGVTSWWWRRQRLAAWRDYLEVHKRVHGTP